MNKHPIKLKRKAGLTSLLLFLQLCHHGGAVIENHGRNLKVHGAEDENNRKDFDMLWNKYDIEDGLVNDQEVSLQKKNFAAFILVPNLITLAIGNGLISSCIHFTNHLESNVKTIDKLQGDLKLLKDKTNLYWNTLKSKQKYLEYIASDQKVINEQINLMKTLEEDIIHVLNPSYLNQIKNTTDNIERLVMENNNKIKIINTEALLSTVYTSIMPFLVVVEFLGVGAIYRTHKLLSSLLFYDFAKEKINLWLAAKKKIFTAVRFITAAKNVQIGAASLPVLKQTTSSSGSIVSQGSKTRLGALPGSVSSGSISRPGPSVSVRHITLDIKEYTNKNTPFSKLKKQFHFKHFMRNNLQRGFSGIKVFGAVLINAAFLGIQIAKILSHKKSCREREVTSFQTIKTLNDMEKNFTLLKKEMKVLENQIDGNFSYVLTQLQSDVFVGFIKTAFNLATNIADETQKTKQASKNMEDFMTNIITFSNVTKLADFQKIQKLTSTLSKSLPTVNENLNCIKRTTQILAKAQRSCEKGISEEKIWLQTRKELLATKKQCHMLKADVTRPHLDKVIDRIMKAKQKSSICIRNNLLLKSIVCRNWYNNMSNIESANSIQGVTVDDVIFFTQRCPLRNVDWTVTHSICFLKANKQAIDNVLERYKRYNKTDVEKSYNSCELSNGQKSEICNLKNLGYIQDYCLQRYSLYPTDMVEKIFQKCRLNISPGEIQYICYLASRKNTYDPDDKSFTFLRNRYGRDVVKNILVKECPYYTIP